MKKFKRILPLLLAFVMVFAIPLAGCGDERVTTLQSISINTDNVKKEFIYGEEFTSEGLEVKAVLKHSDLDTPEEKVLTADEYKVNSMSFRSDYISDYQIKVSYTLGDVTKEVSYDVNVVDAMREIALNTDGAKTTFYTGEAFSSDGLVVKAFVKTEGGAEYSEKTLAASDYQIDSTRFNSKKSGTYEIAVSYSYKGSEKKLTYSVRVIDVLDRITLNVKNVKTKFYTDKDISDDFSCEGISATAYIWNTANGQLEEKQIAQADLTVDSSAFKKEIGVYPIKVSYTYQGVTKSAEYEVMFLASYDGLDVSLKEGVFDTFTLSADRTTVEIDVGNIVVKEANRDGSIGGEVNGYTVKLYKGSEEVALTDSKATVGAGAYNILVTKESDRNPGYMRAGFAIVYVNDNLVDFTFKSGINVQDAGEDIISKTWVFTATYSSGAQRDIASSECEFEVSTMEAGDNKIAQVTYNDYNAKGDKVTKTVEVSYKVNKVFGKIVYTYNYSAIDNSAMGGDQTELKQSDLSGPNAFLKLGTGTAKYRNKDKWNAGANIVEIKNAGFIVTFEGTGLITIGFSSTGSNNQSRVGLTDASGKYLPAVYAESDSAITKDSVQNVYLVKGTSSSELTFVIDKAGEYAITGAANDAYNRGCRIHSIIMEDNVVDPSKIVCDVDFTDAAKFNTGNIANSSVTAPVALKDASGGETGLFVTKSSNGFAANKIVDKNGQRVLQLQGKATVDQNSLKFDVKAGKLKVTVKYFVASSGDYVQVLDSAGAVLGTSSDVEAVGNELVTGTIIIDVASDMTLSLGSFSGVINIGYLKVELV